MCYAYIILCIPLFLFIHYYLKESHPTTIVSSSESGRPIHFIPYQPIVWVTSVWTTFRGNSSLAMTVQAAIIMCMVNRSPLTAVFQRNSPYKQWCGIVIIVPTTARVLILCLLAMVISLLPKSNRDNTVGLTQSFRLGMIAKTIATYVVLLIGFLSALLIAMIVFHIQNSFASPLFPVLTLILCRVWSGQVRNRRSAMYAFVLLPRVFAILGVLFPTGPIPPWLGPEQPNDLRNTILIICAAGMLAFYALVHVQVPALERKDSVGEREEQKAPEGAEDR
ncbi:hypothetical protein DL96DRAFT_346418 [Flagelloscypha sp. PMI_526]|nr:hypothetical protein DL96DRAFT_346418 [Flagelloscypha sp. PMI_526]